MGLAREQTVEIFASPIFKSGEKVRSTKHIKNDGTYPGKEIGENLVRKGDVGYVRDIGVFLQQFYIYAVEFVDRTGSPRTGSMTLVEDPHIEVVPIEATGEALTTSQRAFRQAWLLPQ